MNQNASGFIIFGHIVNYYKLSKMQGVGCWKSHVGDVKMHSMHTKNDAREEVKAIESKVWGYTNDPLKVVWTFSCVRNAQKYFQLFFHGKDNEVNCTTSENIFLRATMN